MASSQTTLNSIKFSFMVDWCSDLTLSEHLFGGEGKYMKSKYPMQIVFYCWGVADATRDYSNKVVVKFNFVWLTIMGGLSKLKTFIVTVGFV